MARALLLSGCVLALGLATSCSPGAFHCKVDHDCDGTFLCRVSTGDCVPASAAECRFDEDCIDARKACWDLGCVARCTTAADCQDSTRTCAGGLCLPLDAAADATP